VKYSKYFGGEVWRETEKRGEKDKVDQLHNFVIFFCVVVDPRYKLSNYIKMATMVYLIMGCPTRLCDGSGAGQNFHPNSKNNSTQPATTLKL
jgi:hypothetical protein